MLCDGSCGSFPELGETRVRQGQASPERGMCQILGALSLANRAAALPKLRAADHP